MTDVNISCQVVCHGLRETYRHWHWHWHCTKPTHSEKILHYYSHRPYIYIYNCANNFIFRTINLTHHKYHSEKTRFVIMTHWPGEPIHKLINRCNAIFNNSINNTRLQVQFSNNRPSNTNRPPTKYHSLTYIKNSSDKIKKTYFQIQ